MDSTQISYIIAVIIIAILGIGARVFWKGFQATIIDAIINSALGGIFKNLNTAIDGLKNDSQYVRTGLDEVRRSQAESRSETNSLRSRFDTHLEVSNAQALDFYNFKREVLDFMARMREHSHLANTPILPPAAVRVEEPKGP